MALVIEQISDTKIWIHDGATSVAEIDTSSGIRINSAFQIGTTIISPAQLAIAANPSSQTITQDGAITLKNGVVALDKAGVLAATLANPTATTDDFKRLTIVALQAQANTVTVTGGFGNGGGGEDIATFSGAIGDNLNLIAYQGYWYVTGSHQITIA